MNIYSSNKIEVIGVQFISRKIFLKKLKADNLDTLKSFELDLTHMNVCTLWALSKVSMWIMKSRLNRGSTMACCQ